VWFGAISGIGHVLSLGATELVRRRVDSRLGAGIGRVLVAVTMLIIVSLAGFGLARNVGLALALLWLIGALRAIQSPLHETWVNQRIDDPQVRATTFSVSSQMDAVGQIAGGPIVGVIGNQSIRAALVTSAALLSPAVPLYLAARRRARDSASQRQTESASQRKE
jgi:DHA3 family tetracycline resistance protein-like MFS transporter